MFLQARLVGSKSKEKEAKALAAKLLVPVWVAAAALKAGGGLSPAQTVKAEQLQEFRSGKYGDYRDWNEKMKKSASNIVDGLSTNSPEEVESVTKAWKAVEPTITRWKQEVPWADIEIAALSKMRRRDAVDEQVLRDLRAIRKKLQQIFDNAHILSNVIISWTTIRATETITPERARQAQQVFAQVWRHLEIPLLELSQATIGAYERYPEEADARAGAEAVYQTARRKARTGGKPVKAAVP